MRSKFLLCLSIAVTIAPAAVIMGAFDGLDRDVIGYNVLSERMFNGAVVGPGHIIDGLMYFPLRTANTILEVQIGPKEFVARNRFELATGEMVTVMGMPVVMKNRQVLLAREVRSTKGVLVVRDYVGLPLWEKDRPILMDPQHRIRISDECAVIK